MVTIVLFLIYKLIPPFFLSGKPAKSALFMNSGFKKTALSLTPDYKILSDTSASCHNPARSDSRKVTQIRFPPEISSKSASHHFP